MNLIQSIRILRDKKDDLWLLYFVEFFKFIGCIITDWLTDYDHGKVIDWEEYWQENYDIELALSVKKHIPEEFADKFVYLWDKCDEFDELCRKKILDCLILKIWGKSECCEDIRYLGQVYASENLFYYLYNEGNLKFIQEYYPIKVEGKKWEKDSRRKACEISFNQFASAYNALGEHIEQSYGKPSVYCEYAMLYLRHKINEMSMMLTEQQVFRTDRILEMAQDVAMQDDKLIRIYYLIATICSKDIMFIHKTEYYYDLALEALYRAGISNRTFHFICYQNGRFAEKVKKNLLLAEDRYSQAYQYNSRDYRAMYKLIQGRQRKGDIREVIEKSNLLIAELLNGYELNEIMPKEAIYGFKCFVMLGDVYTEVESFDLAIKCYEKAIAISKAKSPFYSKWRDMDTCFEQNYKDSMPLQPILFRIINCASQGGNKELIDECYSKM